MVVVIMLLLQLSGGATRLPQTVGSRPHPCFPEGRLGVWRATCYPRCPARKRPAGVGSGPVGGSIPGLSAALF